MQRLIFAVFFVLTAVFTLPAFAHERGHGHSSAQFGVSFGHSSGHYRGGHGVGHRRGHRRQGYRSGSHLSVHVPIVSSHNYDSHQHRADVPRLVRKSHLRATRAPALPDMPSLKYVARRSQNAAQSTRDRRQCQRSAWRQTRPDPRSARLRTVGTERHYSTRNVGSHGDIVHPAAGGAIIGGIGGAIAGDVGAGMVIGAIAGAGSWLLAGGGHSYQETLEHEVQVLEYHRAGGPQPQALRAALVSCMQQRGYAVS